VRFFAAHGIGRIHALYPVCARDLDQVPHQEYCEPTSAPVIVDRYGYVAATPILGMAIAGGSDFNIVTLTANNGNERDFVAIVDIGKASGGIRHGRLHDTEEAIMQ
jgi:hypothetical protein